eukprot:4147225-Lingulodinium_polyedra.AAC.1
MRCNCGSKFALVVHRPVTLHEQVAPDRAGAALDERFGHILGGSSQGCVGFGRRSGPVARKIRAQQEFKKLVTTNSCSRQGAGARGPRACHP